MTDPSFPDILLSLLPILILIGAWWFFMWKMRGRGSEHLALQQRQVEALERIAKALERRAP